MAAGGSFFVTISCVIRGYQVHKEVRRPDIAERVCVLRQGRECS